MLEPLAPPPPLRTPAPHHPDQTVMFPGPVETTYGPLAMTLTITLHRKPRQKCAACGLRRIGYSVGLGELIAGPVLCAKCAGIR